MKMEFKKTWLVTGVAGFVGSHLVEALLLANQNVIGLDNFSTGHLRNIDEVRNSVSSEQWKNFSLIKADIKSLSVCQKACKSVNFVLHQAALASVPASIENPVKAHEVNVTGFINMLTAARDNNVERFVYASSSAVYGEGQELPKVEARISDPISPYAANKYINEVYAKIFNACYGLETIGLRYFNVYGPRQDPCGAYAAVIPKWLEAMSKQQAVYINGDGESTRDFIYVKDIVRANLLAALTEKQDAVAQVYNVGSGDYITLNGLFLLLSQILHGDKSRGCEGIDPIYRADREGDIKHSYADISRAKEFLKFSPKYTFERGLSESVNWHIKGHEVASDETPL